MTTLFLFQESPFNFFLSAAIIGGLGISNANAQTGAAQTDEAQKANAKNSLFGGSWSLQFQINDNFSLSSFQGSTVS